MSITEKYNFKVSIDQFHNFVSSNYYDASEIALITHFENICLNLKNLNKPHYYMIELGSNQCYYSLLFKHIIGKEITTNIMVEPHYPNYVKGQNEFKLNNCEGIFYNKSIGTRWEQVNQTFEVNSVSLDEILQEHQIKQLDVMQCDIDGSELHMLNLSSGFFAENKVKYLFLGTHSSEKHTTSKSMLQNFGYKILVDHPTMDIGHDSLIIAQSSDVD